jgi:hypothetical protein
VDAGVLPALNVLVMPLVVHPVPVQDLSVSAIRTFPIFIYLNHDSSIRVFRFENKMQPLANICVRGARCGPGHSSGEGLGE